MFGPIVVTGTTVVGSGIGIAPAKVRIKYRLKMLSQHLGVYHTRIESICTSRAYWIVEDIMKAHRDDQCLSALNTIIDIKKIRSDVQLNSSSTFERAPN